MSRYALGSKSVVTYGLEGTKYQKATDTTTEFGVTPNDIDVPNENPQTAMATGGAGRTVYLNSPDEKEYNFSVDAVVHDENVPFEIAIGSSSTTQVDVDSDGTDDYEEIIWTESDRLETATVRHINEDLDHVIYFVGTKASMGLSWSQGDPLEASFDLVPAFAEYDQTESAPSFTPSLDNTKTPFRAHHLGKIDFSRSSDDTSIKELATVMSGDLSLDNGLEVNHHGRGRDGYSVSEETSADGRHDHTLEVKVTDDTLHKEAYENGKPVDVEIPFTREEHSNGEMIDGLIVRLKRCAITNANIPAPGEGTVEGEISLMPTEIEIEMRVPL